MYGKYDLFEEGEKDIDEESLMDVFELPKHTNHNEMQYFLIYFDYDLGGLCISFIASLANINLLNNFETQLEEYVKNNCDDS